MLSRAALIAFVGASAIAHGGVILDDQGNLPAGNGAGYFALSFHHAGNRGPVGQYHTELLGDDPSEWSAVLNSIHGGVGNALFVQLPIIRGHRLVSHPAIPDSLG